MQELLPGFDELGAVASAEGMSPEEAQRVSQRAQHVFENTEDVAWMAEYDGLRREGWPWRVACYIAWATTPRKERWPQTQRELASVMGLQSDRVIRTWREKNPSIDLRVQSAIITPLMQARRDVIEALIESATTADHKNHPDRRLALEMTDLYTPRQEVDATVKQAGVFLPELDEDGAEGRRLAAESGAADAVPGVDGV